MRAPNATAMAVLVVGFLVGVVFPALYHWFRRTPTSGNHTEVGVAA